MAKKYDSLAHKVLYKISHSIYAEIPEKDNIQSAEKRNI